MIAEEKTCTGCGEKKPLDQFYVAKRGKFGRGAKCKVCFLAASRERYERPENKARASERERVKRLDPEYREKKRLAAAAWYEKPENKVRAKTLNREYAAQPHRKNFDRERKAAWNRSPAGRAYFAQRQREVRATPDGAAADAARKLLHRVLDATTMPKPGRRSSN